MTMNQQPNGVMPETNSQAKAAEARMREADIANATEDFKSLVNTCRAKERNRWISNLVPSHAAYLLQTLLLMAAKKELPVRIITGEMDYAIYNQLCGALQKCIDAGVEITAVIAKGVDNADLNDFYRMLRHYEGARCFTAAPDYAEKLPHMLVVGDQAFRYEVDPSSYEASANFHSPSTAELLIDYFEEWQSEGLFSEIA